jgi:gluconolactonase
MKSSCLALACALTCAVACSDKGGGADAGGAGGTTGGGGRAGTGGSAAATGGVGGANASGGAGGSGGATATGGTGGTATGGTGGGSGGSTTGGSGGTSASDAAREASADLGGEVNPSARSRCPAGPFPTPMVGGTQDVCANFDFNFSYNEGPTWVAAQNAFYFTNFVQRAPTRGDIIKYTPGGQCEIFVPNVGCNGLAVTPDGAIVAACHQTRNVIRFDLSTKQQTVLADMAMGEMLDTPNDLVVHDNGTIYFTNPPYELGGRPAGVGPGIFRIDPAGVLSAIQMGNPPNGIGLSPDQRRLYVIGGGIWALDESGVPSSRTNFFTGGDGMGVDCAGNVYSSGGNIFNAQGDRIGSFPGGTNLAFGGADGKTLLVAGGGNRVRLLQMNVPGLP